MTSKEMENALEEARKTFEKIPEDQDVETGLNTEDAMKLQLRKACRLLDASEKILEDESNYIVVIDACFTSIERSIHAYLLEKNVVDESDPIFDHEKIYELGRQSGIFNENFELELKQLWTENRSKTYYRDGIPSRPRAKKMFQLAKSVHNHVTGMSNKGHECICK